MLVCTCSVSKSKLITLERTEISVRVNMTALNKHVFHFAAVCSCVHVCRSACTAGDSECEFQARQLIIKSKITNLAHVHACVAYYRIAVHKLDFRLGTAHIYNNRIKSGVTDQHIASVAENERFDVFFFTLFDDRNELFVVQRSEHNRRISADAEGRVFTHRDLTLGLAADARCVFKNLIEAHNVPRNRP